MFHEYCDHCPECAADSTELSLQNVVLNEAGDHVVEEMKCNACGHEWENITYSDDLEDDWSLRGFAETATLYASGSAGYENFDDEIPYIDQYDPYQMIEVVT